MQITRAGEVVAASPTIETLDPLGPAVDGQAIRNIGPLPGGDDDPMRLLESIGGHLRRSRGDPRRRAEGRHRRQRRHVAAVVAHRCPGVGGRPRAAHVGPRRANAAAGRADPGGGGRHRRHRPRPPRPGARGRRRGQPAGDDDERHARPRRAGASASASLRRRRLARAPQPDGRECVRSWRSTSPIRTPPIRRRLIAACWRRLSGCSNSSTTCWCLPAATVRHSLVIGGERFDLGDVVDARRPAIAAP